MQEYLDDFISTGKIPPKKILDWFCGLLDGAFIDKEILKNLQEIEQKYEPQLKRNQQLEIELQSINKQLQNERSQVEVLKQQLNKLRDNKTAMNNFTKIFEEKKKDIHDQQVTKDTSNMNSVLKWED